VTDELDRHQHLMPPHLAGSWRLRAAVALLCLGIGTGNVLAEAHAEGQATQSVEGGDPQAREVARRIAAVLAQVEYVPIPAGGFQMGCSTGETDCSDDQKPAHQVRITRGFEIGKYEVTQAVWNAVMGTNPSMFKGPKLPVEQVSWNEVQEFLAVLNGRGDSHHYRLPTEAEWEYASRAGTTGAHYGDLDTIAWYARNSGNQTHPVGQKQPNAWGLYDMQGNVWEWCEDWYQADYYARFSKEPAVDPQGPETGEYRVVRGGSWYKYLWFVRASSRLGVRPGSRYPHVGFRCVRQSR
jgi:formylglycine-generating enzyme required for sulfatase activity